MVSGSMAKSVGRKPAQLVRVRDEVDFDDPPIGDGEGREE
jgi:hypothetical protein